MSTCIRARETAFARSGGARGPVPYVSRQLLRCEWPLHRVSLPTVIAAFAVLVGYTLGLRAVKNIRATVGQKFFLMGGACRAPRGKRSAAPTARGARLDLFHKHITTYGLRLSPARDCWFLFCRSWALHTRACRTALGGVETAGLHSQLLR